MQGKYRYSVVIHLKNSSEIVTTINGDNLDEVTAEIVMRLHEKDRFVMIGSYAAVRTEEVVGFSISHS